jgi:hypothetical protein
MISKDAIAFVKAYFAEHLPKCSFVEEATGGECWVVKYIDPGGRSIVFYSFRGELHTWHFIEGDEGALHRFDERIKSAWEDSERNVAFVLGILKRYLHSTTITSK